VQLSGKKKKAEGDWGPKGQGSSRGDGKSLRRLGGPKAQHGNGKKKQKQGEGTGKVENN